MVDLWTGLFATLVGGVIGVGSVVGARITGHFMLAQQERDNRRRANEAVQALLVELEENRALIVEMVQRLSFERLEPSQDPARLKRFVWETQLPLIASVLDPATLSAVVKAYRSTDSFRGLGRRSDGSYVIGEQQNKEIIMMREISDQAIAAVRPAAGLPEQPRS